MGTRAMTTEPRRLHQSQVLNPTSGEEEEEGEVMELEERGVYGQWETQQQQGTTSFWGSIYLKKTRVH